MDLPFSLVKQNLLLAVLDGLHLSYEAGVGYVSISQISERWETVPDSHVGIAGVANITLVTIRDQPYVNMGEARDSLCFQALISLLCLHPARGSFWCYSPVAAEHHCSSSVGGAHY